MQTLEKCMEDMKAIFKLNEEKLTFNFKVLKEREKVNKATGDTLKKRRAEIMEAVRNEKIKFTKKQSEYQYINVKLTKDYKNYTNIFKDL
jgi:dynein regulatory complex protein 1